MNLDRTVDSVILRSNKLSLDSFNDKNIILLSWFRVGNLINYNNYTLKKLALQIDV